MSTRKWCFVPGCENTTNRTPKKVFITVPKNAKKRQKWFEVARRSIAEVSEKSTLYCCEDHFNSNSSTSAIGRNDGSTLRKERVPARKTASTEGDFSSASIIGSNRCSSESEGNAEDVESREGTTGNASPKRPVANDFPQPRVMRRDLLRKRFVSKGGGGIRLLANTLRNSMGERDEFAIFGEHVACKIRKLPTKYARSTVQHLINTVLYEADLGKYDSPTSPDRFSSENIFQTTVTSFETQNQESANYSPPRSPGSYSSSSNNVDLINQIIKEEDL